MKRLQKTIEPKPRPDVPRQLVIAFEAPQLWMMQPPDRQRIVSSLANLLMQAAGDDPAAFPLRECNRRKWRPFFGGPGGSRIQGEWPVERRGFEPIAIASAGIRHKVGNFTRVPTRFTRENPARSSGRVSSSTAETIASHFKRDEHSRPNGFS